MTAAILVVSIVSLALGGSPAEDGSPFDADKLSELSIEDLLDLQVITASSTSEKTSEAPGVVLVVTSDEIRERQYRNLSDLLKDLPGFDIVDYAGRFGEFFTIRGIDGNDRFIVLVDGHRVNAPSGWFLSTGGSFSMQMAERVEVLYGPASVIYGSDAFSAVINIITKKPPTSEKIRLSLDGVYGSFDSRDVSAEASTSIKDSFSLVAMARLLDADGFVFPSEGVFRAIDSYPPPLAPRMEQPTHDHSIYAEAQSKSFRLGYFRQHFDQGSALGLSPRLYIYNRDSRWVVNSDIAWLNYRRDLGPAGQLTVETSAQQWGLGPDTQYLTYSSMEGIAHEHMTGRDRALGLSLTYSVAPIERLRLVTGAGYHAIESLPPYTNGVTISENRVGVFGQASYDPIPKLTFAAAARYEYSSALSSSFDPRLAVIYRPSSETSVRLIYGSAFQAPSLFYRYERFETLSYVLTPESAFETKLRNQRVRSADLAVTQALGAGVILDADVFYTDARDLIGRVQYTSSVFSPRYNVFTNGFRNDNVGRQRAYGGWLRASARVWKQLEAKAHYTYTKASIEESTIAAEAIDLPRVAAHKLGAGLTYHHGYGTVFSGVRWIKNVSVPTHSLVYPGEQVHPGNAVLTLALNVSGIVKYVEAFAKGQLTLGERNQIGLYDSDPYTDLIPLPHYTLAGGVRVTWSDD